MECIYCSGKTNVVNSRPQKRLMQVWRRRSCKVCGAVFTTNETVDLASSLVVRDARGTISPFKRDKLFLSIARACGHRKDAIEAASALTATAIAKLRLGSSTAEVKVSDIVKHTHETLRRFDTAAAVQYQAYHKG